MGVQKSRKSIRYTKYSLKKKNVLFLFFNKQKIKNILKKFIFKKKDIFFLKKRETQKELFF
jgi:hypothetical protein